VTTRARQPLFDALASDLGHEPRAELVDVPAQGERHVDGRTRRAGTRVYCSLGASG
jgi:hypothetical protein